MGKKEDKLGIRVSSTCPVYLDNVKVLCCGGLGLEWKVELGL